jgi:membrane associated rhomboid family serine protease
MPAKAKLTTQLKMVICVMLIFSIIEIVNILCGRCLNTVGNYPRHIFALTGIFSSHFIHGDFNHFASNIVTLGIFYFLMLQYGTKRTLYVSVFIVMCTGILVWLFARPAMHIGASGLIYGYLGFLILAGIMSTRIKLLGISLLVAFFYGGLIFGLLPNRPFVSWESHLFGFLSGLIAAKLWTKSR